MKKSIQFLLMIVLGLTLDSCFNEKYPVVDLTTPPSETIISFSNDIQPVLNSNCISCHFTNSNLPDFTTGISYDTMTDLIVEGGIVPGDAAGSELMEMLNHDPTNPNPMPPDAPMSSKNITLFANWINQGAKNN